MYYQVRKSERNEKCNGSRLRLNGVTAQGWNNGRMMETSMGWRMRGILHSHTLKFELPLWQIGWHDRGAAWRNNLKKYSKVPFIRITFIQNPLYPNKFFQFFFCGKTEFPPWQKLLQQKYSIFSTTMKIILSHITKINKYWHNSGCFKQENRRLRFIQNFCYLNRSLSPIISNKREFTVWIQNFS